MPSNDLIYTVVAVSLTLLSLGVRNIHLGPNLPAFITPPVLNVLVAAGDTVNAESPNSSSSGSQVKQFQSAPKSEMSEKGRVLFDELNCMACHSIHSVGGDLAPALDGVGERRSEQFLITRLSSQPEDIEAFEKANSAALHNRAAHSRYSAETTRSLIAYLRTLPPLPEGYFKSPHVFRFPADNPTAGKIHFEPLPESAATREGAAAYDKNGCVSCHAIGDVGGWVGPRLDGIGTRPDAKSILKQITSANGQQVDSTPSSTMPDFKMDPTDAQKIVQYLLSLPDLSHQK